MVVSDKKNKDCTDTNVRCFSGTTASGADDAAKREQINENYEKHVRKTLNESIKTNALSLLGIAVGSLISAANLAIFVREGGLTPGGFTGLSLIIQRAALKFFNVTIPFSPLSLLFNFIPALAAFRIIGKKYTVFSFISVVIYSVMADVIPSVHVTDDMLLIALFGGIISGIASSMVLNSGACGGGTDFIAMSVSVKTGKSMFNAVFAFNIILLIISGIMFGMEPALYTIIYLFVFTQVLNYFYKRYEKKTLFIVTAKPKEVAAELRKLTNHSCTIFEGEGAYTEQVKYIVYSIVSSDELNDVRRHINYIDSEAFINVVNSAMVTGNFYLKPLG